MVHFYRGIIFTCILKQFICIVEARIDIRIVCNDVLAVGFEPVILICAIDKGAQNVV